ncbi:MAG: 50S ribosomal protein L10 [Vulcanibacillus sp.]
MGVREEKGKVVSEIIEKFKNSKTTIITDYRGLDVTEITQLRKNLREAGVEYRVLKNSLVRRATAEIELTELDEFLKGPTAIAFSDNDLVAPAKILFEFAKKNTALEIKAGLLEGSILSFEQVKNLATLPSREGLLSMLLSVLQAPMRNMACVVKAVAEIKET